MGRDNLIPYAGKPGASRLKLSPTSRRPSDDERRAGKRRSRADFAWIVLSSGEIVKCGVLDRSEEGLRLHSKEAAYFPEETFVYLDRGHLDQRRCRVIWRNDTECGVQFI